MFLTLSALRSAFHLRLVDVLHIPWEICKDFHIKCHKKTHPKHSLTPHRQGSHPEWYPNLTKNSSILDFQKFMYERFPGAKKGWGHFLGGHWMSLAALLNPLFSLNLRLVVFLCKNQRWIRVHKNSEPALG